MPLASFLLATTGFVITPFAWPRQADWMEYRNTASIWQHVVAGNCDGAAEELTRLIPQGDPKVLLLAADLTERGFCLAGEWEKSAALYQRAFAKNETAALPMLVHVHALKGRDPAAALWWAGQRPDMVPPACRTKAPPAQADAFVEELRNWPQERLVACVQNVHLTFNLWHTLSYVRGKGIPKRIPVEITVAPSDGSIRWREAGKGSFKEVRMDYASGALVVGRNEPIGDLDELVWFDAKRLLNGYRALASHGDDWTVTFTIDVERPSPNGGVPTFIDVAN